MFALFGLIFVFIRLHTHTHTHTHPHIHTNPHTRTHTLTITHPSTHSHITHTHTHTHTLQLGTNEGVAEFARRTSHDLAGLRNDTSATASKISQASLASASAAYSDIADWLERVTGASLKAQPLEQGLKSGDVLCAAMTKIKPALMPKFHKDAKLAFKQMENIGLFLNACRAYGVSDTELFITIDLFEAANMKQVLACIRALRTKAEANGFKA